MVLSKRKAEFDQKDSSKKKTKRAERVLHQALPCAKTLLKRASGEARTSGERPATSTANSKKRIDDNAGRSTTKASEVGPLRDISVVKNQRPNEEALGSHGPRLSSSLTLSARQPAPRPVHAPTDSPTSPLKEFKIQKNLEILTLSQNDIVPFKDPISNARPYLSMLSSHEIKPPPNTCWVSTACIHSLNLIKGNGRIGLTPTKSQSGETIPGKPRRLLLLEGEINPLGPRAGLCRQGQRGLVLTFRREFLAFAASNSKPRKSRWSVFSSGDRGDGLWLYLGEYIVEAEEWESAICFRDQIADEMKLRMTHQILQDTKTKSTVALRNDILRNPEEKENGDVLANAGTVVHAFLTGNQKLTMLKFACKSYDHTFAKQVTQRWELCYKPEDPQPPSAAVNPVVDSSATDLKSQAT